MTHGLGLILSLVALPRLISLAVNCGEARHLVSAAVYGASLVLLYLASTLYHSARAPRRKQLFLNFDYVCIYLLIAGTYTPFTMVLLDGTWGWTLFGLVWSCALLGIGVRLLAGRRFDVISTGTYVVMAWMVLVALGPVVEQLSRGCLLWLSGGGAFYMVGVGFYAQRRKYMHTVWHLFVLAGSACHYVAVVRYVLVADTWY